MVVKIKRVSEASGKEDGQRILVDRLWPRGLTKEKAKVDLWFKDIAPSGSLRKWFGHDPEKWEKFKKRYFQDLEDKGKILKVIKKEIMKAKTVTFVFAAKDTEHNNAVALREYLIKKFKEI